MVFAPSALARFGSFAYIGCTMTPPRNLEIEIKLQLESFPDYLKLVGFLGPIQDEDHHLNVFFDSSDRRLSKNGAALRLRAETWKTVDVNSPAILYMFGIINRRP